MKINPSRAVEPAADISPPVATGNPKAIAVAAPSIEAILVQISSLNSFDLFLSGFF